MLDAGDRPNPDLFLLDGLHMNRGGYRPLEPDCRHREGRLLIAR